MGQSVQLSNVTFCWKSGQPVILDIAEFSVSAGERIFVSGPSGSGKTTLLNLLGGVAVPNTGHIMVGDVRIDQLSSSARDAFRADGIGFIFQSFNLVPYLSVVENVLLPCRFSESRRGRASERSGDPVAEAHRLLSKMGLPADIVSGRSVADFSTGQQQRIAAARALIGTPGLVIADEPTSALDEESRKAFLDLLFAEVAAEDQTLIFVSHDRRLKNLFDRHIALSDVNVAHAVGAAM
jgi:putative ABC transport system ATP-binding protein